MELGIEWIWLGLESSETSYAKLKGTDTLALVRELQAHVICVHGSTIIGLEHHTPANIGADIARAIALETVFHQFMLYTPMPGTALHAQIAAEGRLLTEPTWRIRTGSSSSTSGTRRSRGTSRRCRSTVRSAWISSATGQASSG